VIFVLKYASRVVFKDGILGTAHQFWGNPYLNSTTIPFDNNNNNNNNNCWGMRLLSLFVGWPIASLPSASVVMGWDARLFFAILRATLVCVRGSRQKWKSLGIINGAPLFETTF